MRRLITGTLVLAACAILIPSLASARPAYRIAFMKNYDVKADANLANAKCQLCHMGTDKTVRNPYGKDLAKVLAKQEATPDEAIAAMKKVEGMPSSDKKTNYIELIKMDKLPGS